MTVLEAHDVRVRDVSVLIDFVRIVGRDSALSRKRELCDDVDNLLLARINYDSFLALF